MAHRFLDRLKHQDAALGDAIRSKHTDWFETLETALDCVIQGLNDFGEFKVKPQGELESGWLFLATRTFRNLHMALNTLERGYYQQSLGLVRMAMEDMLVAKDIENYPKTLSALLFDEHKLGRDELQYQAMADRISEQTGNAWRIDYGDVSKYGAHPRMKALESSVRWSEQTVPHLSLASHYDEDLVAACVVMVAGESVNVMGVAIKLLHGTRSNWLQSARSPFENLETLIDEIGQIASENQDK